MGRAIRWIAGAAAALMAGSAPAHEGHGAHERPAPRIVEGSLEVVGTGYGFTEGPAWDGSRLIFSDIPGDTVHVYTPGEGAPTVLYTPSAMANGHTFDRAGRLLNAEHGSGALTRWTAEGGRQVVVETFEGKHLNSPNDVAVRSDGLIVFTDPPYGLAAGYQGVKREAELAFSGVFALDEASGRMVLIDGTLERPNGAAFSPDEKTLYVTDSATQKVWAYTIAADGSASRKRLVIDVTDESKPGRAGSTACGWIPRGWSMSPARAGSAWSTPRWARWSTGWRPPSAPPTLPGAGPICPTSTSPRCRTCTGSGRALGERGRRAVSSKGSA